MAPGADQSEQPVNSAIDGDPQSPVDRPSTPQEHDAQITSSQMTIPSSEGPSSPIDLSQSFKTEVNEDRISRTSVIPSSLTPPPSSQVPSNNGGGAAGHPLGYVNTQRTGIFSPPATTLNNVRRDAASSSEYAAPTPRQVVEATADELRSMLQNAIAEHARLKMETAHHKLQYNLLSLQADEDAKRAAVEHEMNRREVEALRGAEHSRQARRDLSAASESAQARYLQVRLWYEQAVDENESLNKRLRGAKKIIKQKCDEIVSLSDERDLLLNRIRENREHFRIFHTALTPKSQSVSTPVHYRATPRQTPQSASHRDRAQEPFDVLLKAATQENNSAPSSPTTSYRPVPRIQSKHTRNVQSLSSLPTTPISRPRGPHAGLLPSVDLVPQTEPARYRHSHHHGMPETPTPTRHHPAQHRRRESRESTISAEDNEELARQALHSFASRGSHGSRHSHHSHRRQHSHHSRVGDNQDGGAEEEVFESQASQAASEMLRRDPRESFEVASSNGGGAASRDVTPPPGSQASALAAAAAEKTAKLQARLFAGLSKSAAAVSPEKRKFSGGDDARRDRDPVTSPTKKLRLAGGLRDPGRVGLGIQYGQEA